MVLNKQPGAKQGPQWLHGVWVGKTNEDDLHLVIGSAGLLRGKAIRRTSEPWRSVYVFLVKTRPYRSPNVRRAMRLMPATPMVPRGVRGPGRKAQASGLETPAVDQGGEQDFVRDKDADDVHQQRNIFVSLLCHWD